MSLAGHLPRAETFKPGAFDPGTALVDAAIARGLRAKRPFRVLPRPAGKDSLRAGRAAQRNALGLQAFSPADPVAIGPVRRDPTGVETAPEHVGDRIGGRGQRGGEGKEKRLGKDAHEDWPLQLMDRNNG